MEISLEEINGYWKTIEKSGSENLKDTDQWIFAYDTLEIYESDNSTSKLKAKYFKIKDSILVNYTPYDFENFLDKKACLYLIPGLISANSLAKIDLQDNILTVYPLDTQYIIDKIEMKKYNLEFFEYGSSIAKSYIFVSKPKDWIDFLNDNIHDESLFDDSNKLVFERIM